jgi:hypothetical protein
MKKQLKTAEEMAVEFHNRSRGMGLSGQELRDLLSLIMREGGHDPNDEIVRTEIRQAHKSAAA